MGWVASPCIFHYTGMYVSLNKRVFFFFGCAKSLLFHVHVTLDGEDITVNLSLELFPEVMMRAKLGIMQKKVKHAGKE